MWLSFKQQDKTKGFQLCNDFDLIIWTFISGYEAKEQSSEGRYQLSRFGSVKGLAATTKKAFHKVFPFILYYVSYLEAYINYLIIFEVNRADFRRCSC